MYGENGPSLRICTNESHENLRVETKPTLRVNTDEPLARSKDEIKPASVTAESKDSLKFDNVFSAFEVVSKLSAKKLSEKDKNTIKSLNLDEISNLQPGLLHSPRYALAGRKQYSEEQKMVACVMLAVAKRAKAETPRQKAIASQNNLSTFEDLNHSIQQILGTYIKHKEELEAQKSLERKSLDEIWLRPKF